MSRAFSRHDNFFAKSLGQKEVARDFFKAYLPKAFRETLDLDSLKLEKANTKIVRDGIIQHEVADILFKAANTEGAVLLLVHIEHLSSPNKIMPLRAVHYAAGILLDYAAMHPDTPLPPIVTLVYYHGKQKPYPYSMKVNDLFEGLSDSQKDLILQPVLIDLSTYDDEALSNHGMMTPVDTLLKYIFDIPSRPTLEKMLSILSKSDQQIRLFGLQYITSRFNLSEDDFIKSTQKYLDEEEIMTIAEQMEQRIRKKIEQEVEQQVIQRIMEKGLKKGMQRGIQRGLQKGLLQGIEEGLQQGLQKGMEKGLQQGLQKGMEKGIQQGLQQGVQQGMEEGLLQGIRIIAKSLLGSGLDMDFVSKHTGLDIPSVRNLQREINP